MGETGERVMSASIELRGLSKTFGSGPEAVHAFGPADLTIREGEFVSLLGPSGCGKSTLMLIIAGLLAPSAGDVRVDGKAVEGPQTDIGIMFQDNTLVPWRNVWDNVGLQLELRGLDVRQFADRIRALLASVSLGGFEDRHPWELSGGMQQRAAFCQAMVHEPDTLLLDEPLGKLDAMTRESIRSDLQALWMSKRPTVVFVTHSIEEAVQLSSRICVITPRPGRIERVIDVDLPYPRTLEVKKSREFVTLVGDIQEIFHGYGVL
jgi:NitT/TauT family transport system ATP-binding protein